MAIPTLARIQARRHSDLPHVSETIGEMRESLTAQRDQVIQRAHADERRGMARAWDRLITHLDKWQTEALRIELSCRAFYGRQS